MRSLLPGLCFIGLIMLAALTFQAGDRAFADEKIRIVAAENFYADLARQIGGDRVEVTGILANPDQDPHLFEAAPSTARALSQASIVLYNGAGYDMWMDKLFAASTGKDRATIAAADLMNYREGGNPHLWYEPGTFSKMADALAKELSRQDPAHAGAFAENLRAFQLSYGQVLNRITAMKARYDNIKVTATEPVFGYMAAALGFEMLNGEFQIAIMNDTEPSPRQVAAFEQSLRDGSARILFYNSQVTDDTTRRLLDLARANKVAIIGVTETEPAGQTLQTWFGNQLNDISAALERLGR